MKEFFNTFGDLSWLGGYLAAIASLILAQSIAFMREKHNGNVSYARDKEKEARRNDFEMNKIDQETSSRRFKDFEEPLARGIHAIDLWYMNEKLYCKFYLGNELVDLEEKREKFGIPEDSGSLWAPDAAIFENLTCMQVASPNESIWVKLDSARQKLYEYREAACIADFALSTFQDRKGCKMGGFDPLELAGLSTEAAQNSLKEFMELTHSVVVEHAATYGADVRELRSAPRRSTGYELGKMPVPMSKRRMAGRFRMLPSEDHAEGDNENV